MLDAQGVCKDVVIGMVEWMKGTQGDAEMLTYIMLSL
jgi:hypothetical protein